MKSTSIAWCGIAIAAACLGAAPATAQTWPARPVRIIVPYAPGGGIDTVARIMAQKLAEQTGGTFVVENRSGAAGVLGAELVARAAPDGKEKLAKSGNEYVMSPPDEFVVFLRAEIAKWTKVVREANIKLE